MIEHGLNKTYTHGKCRCQLCRTAHAVEMKRYHQRKRTGMAPERIHISSIEKSLDDVFAEQTERIKQTLAGVSYRLRQGVLDEVSNHLGDLSFEKKGNG